MKNTKLVAILVLQAIMVMGILAHVNGWWLFMLVYSICFPDRLNALL